VRALVRLWVETLATGDQAVRVPLLIRLWSDSVALAAAALRVRQQSRRAEAFVPAAEGRGWRRGLTRGATTVIQVDATLVSLGAVLRALVFTALRWRPALGPASVQWGPALGAKIRWTTALHARVVAWVRQILFPPV